MAGVTFMLRYPHIDTFEHLYQDEDVPIGEGLSSEYARTFEAFERLYLSGGAHADVLDKLVGKTRFVVTRDRSPEVAHRNPETRRRGGRPRIRVVTR